jgi:hypothetical protein
MNEDMSDLPQAENADPDGVQVALRAAQTLWSRGDTTESLRWLRKAAESASDEGADLRSLQLAKAAAELRAKLFGTSEPARSPAPTAGARESGAHPIAQPRSDSESPRAPLSASAAVDAFAGGMAPDAEAVGPSSRPVTATQYPSHRPRQRIGLASSPGTMSSMAMSSAQRDGAAYAAVPSWSADSERRISTAPPPLPRRAIEDYEELDAEPDEEAPADDPASVWSSAGPESWQPADSGNHTFSSSFKGSSAPPSAPATTPPPLPPRGAFADDGDFGDTSDLRTVVIPPAEENGDDRVRESQRIATSFSAQDHALEGQTLQHNAWDQESRTVGWEQDTAMSWANEVQATWGSGTNIDPKDPEPAPQSETGRAKLTARVHHQAVRVSFAPDLRVPGQYVVRPLREGEKAGTGERVALLVGLEPGVPLV